SWTACAPSTTSSCALTFTSSGERSPPPLCGLQAVPALAVTDADVALTEVAELLLGARRIVGGRLVRARRLVTRLAALPGRVGSEASALTFLIAIGASGRVEAALARVFGARHCRRAVFAARAGTIAAETAVAAEAAVASTGIGAAAAGIGAAAATRATAGAPVGGAAAAGRVAAAARVGAAASARVAAAVTTTCRDQCCAERRHEHEAKCTGFGHQEMSSLDHAALVPPSLAGRHKTKNVASHSVMRS